MKRLLRRRFGPRTTLARHCFGAGATLVRRCTHFVHRWDVQVRPWYVGRAACKYHSTPLVRSTYVARP